MDALGTPQQALYPQGDGVQFDYGARDLVNLARKQEARRSPAPGFFVQ